MQNIVVLIYIVLIQGFNISSFYHLRNLLVVKFSFNCLSSHGNFEGLEFDR